MTPIHRGSPVSSQEVIKTAALAYLLIGDVVSDLQDRLVLWISSHDGCLRCEVVLHGGPNFFF